MGTSDVAWAKAMAIAVALVVTVPGLAGAANMRHSGTIVATSREAGTLTLDELGPWNVHDGKTVVTKITVKVTAPTEWTLVRRTQGIGPGGWGNEWLESSIEPWQVRPGDYATVAMSPGRGHLAATVLVSELDTR